MLKINHSDGETYLDMGQCTALEVIDHDHKGNKDVSIRFGQSIFKYVMTSRDAEHIIENFQDVAVEVDSLEA